MVRNEEKKPFCQLTPEEMGEIASAIVRGDIEYWSSFSQRWMAPGRAMGGIDLDAAYRTKPRHLVIPWEVIRPEYKWAAMDNSGNVWLHENEPAVRRTVWESGAGKSACAYALNIDTTGIDWRESLTRRPEGV